MDGIDLRWDVPRERDAILAFIAAMGFTPRDASTWDGLAMRAVCAWRGERLIGVLPIEPRPLRISLDQTVVAAHLTCVAVHPDERGAGVGSAMQRLLAADPPTGAKLVTVYREEPESQGYRWYLTNGFEAAMHIVSWTLLPDTGRKARTIKIAAICEARSSAWKRIQSGGVVDQRRRLLADWLAVHPYRGRYAFHIVDVGDAYAVIGTGTLHSVGGRLDVLDFIAPDAAAARDLLIACVEHARSEGTGTIRIALAERDPNADVADRLGFAPGWNFDFLIRPLHTRFQFDPTDWRYASIDFA